MMYEKKPCGGCWKLLCEQTECPGWQVWFLESWERFNRYAWAQMDALGRREPEKFCYELPHMRRSPCEDCMCSAWCDVPCSLRLKWWDERVHRRR